jgi:hypothetical protein
VKRQSTDLPVPAERRCEPDRLVGRCIHCSWWTFAHNDELGPRDLERSIRAHVRRCHRQMLLEILHRHTDVAVPALISTPQPRL